VLLGDGIVIEVQPLEDAEASEVKGPDGLGIVCLPGGRKDGVELQEEAEFRLGYTYGLTDGNMSWLVHLINAVSSEQGGR
jgi:hypothetical protein